MRVLSCFCAVAVVAAAVAAPLHPQSQRARDAARVPGREQRPVLAFPAAEGWTLQEKNAGEKVVTRTFQPARPGAAPDEPGASPGEPGASTGEPGASPGFDMATATVMRGIWNADLEKAQHVYGRKLSAECEGVRATLWLADSGGQGRRLVLWKCEQAQPPFAALQLLLQGRDDLFSVELYSRSGIPADGVLVRWAEWLKDVRLCERGQACPEGLWDR